MIRAKFGPPVGFLPSLDFRVWSSDECPPAPGRGVGGEARECGAVGLQQLLPPVQFSPLTYPPAFGGHSAPGPAVEVCSVQGPEPVLYVREPAATCGGKEEEAILSRQLGKAGGGSVWAERDESLVGGDE